MRLWAETADDYWGEATVSAERSEVDGALVSGPSLAQLPDPNEQLPQRTCKYEPDVTTTDAHLGVCLSEWVSVFVCLSEWVSVCVCVPV